MNIMQAFHIELILGFKDDLTIILNGLLFLYLLEQPFDIEDTFYCFPFLVNLDDTKTSNFSKFVIKEVREMMI